MIVTLDLICFRFSCWHHSPYLSSPFSCWAFNKNIHLPLSDIDSQYSEAVEASQKWVRNLYFCLYLGQFSTDFQNSVFLWKLMKIAIWLQSGCAVAYPAHPLPPPLILYTGVLGLHEFWAREKFIQAKFLLVKLCTSSFVKLCASEILSIWYPRNGLHLKIRASKIGTSEICASQGPPVFVKKWWNINYQRHLSPHLKS